MCARQGRWVIDIYGFILLNIHRLKTILFLFVLKLRVIMSDSRSPETDQKDGICKNEETSTKGK